MEHTEGTTPGEVRSSEGLGRTLVERLRGGVYGTNRIALCEEAATELERVYGLLDRMDAELRNERDPRSTVQRALVIAALLPHNQTKPAGAVREAAKAMFGADEVEAAMRVWVSP